MHYIAHHNLEKCRRCGVCSEIVACPGAEEEICIGCGACVLACRYQAIELREENRESDVLIEVDGKLRRVPERISVKEALEEIGYKVSSCLPAKGALYVPCQVGACWSCALEIDGNVRQACITEVKEGMRIRTELPKEWVPLRIIGQSMGHPSAGVGTPWQLKQYRTPVEVCCLVAGCNLRCPQCQNWFITYKGKGQHYSPREGAEFLTELRKQSNVNRFCISGGECTINRTWLVQLLKELKDLNPEPETRIHISTNGSLLTENYVDELVDAGLTDIGIDLKAIQLDTFMRITGLVDRELAQRCKENAWKAVGYVSEHYREKVFMGIGIPYNKALISLEEIRSMGREIYNVDSSLQVIANDFRGEYQGGILRPTWEEMNTVHQVLNATGLTTVLCQTKYELIGP